MQNTSIRQLSTDVVPPSKRFDYWTGTLCGSMFPLIIKSERPEEFDAKLSHVSLGPLSVIKHSNNGSGSRRTPHELARSNEHSYHMMMCLNSPWSVEHCGRERLRRDDMVIIDSRYAHDLFMSGNHDVLSLKMPANWLETWVPDTAALSGRRIAQDASWGRVLSLVLKDLSPELLIHNALPHSLIVDHIGSLLALLIYESDGVDAAQRRLLTKIHEAIRERCCDPGLDAQELAKSLRMPPHTVHETLAAAAQTFAQELLNKRLELALELLVSPSCKQLSTVDIGVKAGFVDHQYFRQQCRLLTGHTPDELRASN